MSSNKKVKTMVVAALLCSIGILIPLISPIKLVLEPASFTLASHVPLFIAMFISPFVSVSVAVVTTLGFLIGGFPIVVVLRALSHVIFAMIGSYILKKTPEILSSKSRSMIFGLLIAVIHGLGEILVVMPFYFGNSLSSGYYSSGFFYAVIVLVGIGTVVHSMVDFVISYIIWNSIKNTRALKFD